MPEWYKHYWSEYYMMDTEVIRGDKGCHNVEIKRQFC